MLVTVGPHTKVALLFHKGTLVILAVGGDLASIWGLGEPGYPCDLGSQKHRLTFWPRFFHSRNSSMNRVQVKDLGALGPGSCT